MVNAFEYIAWGVALRKRLIWPILGWNALLTLAKLFTPFVNSLKDYLVSGMNGGLEELLKSLNLEMQTASSEVITRALASSLNRIFIFDRSIMFWGYTGDYNIFRPGEVFTFIVKNGLISRAGDSSQPYFLYEAALIWIGILGLILSVALSFYLMACLKSFFIISFDPSGLGIPMFFSFLGFYEVATRSVNLGGLVITALCIPFFLAITFYFSISKVSRGLWSMSQVMTSQR